MAFSHRTISLAWLLTTIFLVNQNTSIIFAADATAQDTDPATKDIRNAMIEWTKRGALLTLPQTRQLMHAEGVRESAYADYLARECWQEAKAQQAVRDKWGSAAEARFAHLYGTDTLEDDQAADVHVDGDHATLTWNVKEIDPAPMIKVNGKWLLDVHIMLQEAIKDDPNGDKDDIVAVPLMKQITADIAAGKYADADACLADFEKKLNALDDDDDDN